MIAAAAREAKRALGSNHGDDSALPDQTTVVGGHCDVGDTAQADATRPRVHRFEVSGAHGRTASLPPLAAGGVAGGGEATRIALPYSPAARNDRRGGARSETRTWIEPRR